MSEVNIDKIREQERARAKRYYEKHSEVVKQKRKEHYSKIKEARKAKAPQPPPPPAPTTPAKKTRLMITKTIRNKATGEIIRTEKHPAPEPIPFPAYDPEPEPEPEPEPAPSPAKKGRIYKVVNKKTGEVLRTTVKPNGEKQKYNIQELIDIFHKRFINKDMPENTYKTYKTTLRRLEKMIGTVVLYPLINNPKKMFKTIEEAKQPNGSPYGISAVKMVYQVIIKSIDDIKLDVEPEIRKEYELKFKAFDHEVREMPKAKTTSEEFAIPTFKEYLERVKAKYPELSREYLLPRLYDELTVRDDFYLLRTNSEKETKDNKDNWVVIDRAKPVKIVINSHKTESSKGTIKKTLSVELSKLLRDYAAKENIPDGAPLFGATKKFSAFISDLTKNIGYDLGREGGIGLFRKMKASETLKNIDDITERQRVAEEMGHSLYMQQYVYKRQQT